MTPYEREMHICWNDEDKTASIYCSSIAAKRKLDDMVKNYPDIYTKVSDDGYEGHYYVDSKYIRFVKPMSESAKQQLREHNKNTRFNAKVSDS